MKVQSEMAERAIELLALPDDGERKLILDLGCGSGLSGRVIAEHGHYWVGMDISHSMLEVARKRLEELRRDEFLREAEAQAGSIEMQWDDPEEESMEYDKEDEEHGSSDDGSSSDSDSSAEPVESADLCIDLFEHDMGTGVCFRPGSIDGCISISALQWLSHSNRSHENPKARLTRLFNTLFGALARGARAVFQFYPENSSQIDLILGCAMKAGFTGGLVVDFPNSTKAKKYYLCLMTGPAVQLPSALEDPLEGEEQVVGVGGRRTKFRKSNRRVDGNVHDKGWVKGKKELARKRGQEVKSDSKYTARKRRIKF